jgi:Tfp pilus assembly protein PilN
MSTDNSNENGAISAQDAVSLLMQPPEPDKVDDEQSVEAAAVEEQPEVSEPEYDEAEADAEAEEYDGEDVEDDTEESDEPEQPEVYTVKVDGQEYEVTLDELRSGYSRQQHFTKRSQELAEQRKAFEQEAAETKQYRDYYAQQLEQLSNQLQQTIPSEPDWSALSQQYEAKELFAMKAEYDRRKEEIARVEQERERIAQQQSVEAQHQMQQHLATQKTEMLERIPAWRDEGRRNKERLDVIKYAQDVIGFSEQEIANASDARAIEMLYKAWQYDKLQKDAPAVKKKVQSAPKVAKGGQPKTKAQVQTRQRRDAMNKLTKTKSIDAAVEFLMSGR